MLGATSHQHKLVWHPILKRSRREVMPTKSTAAWVQITVPSTPMKRKTGRAIRNRKAMTAAREVHAKQEMANRKTMATGGLSMRDKCKLL